MLRKLTFCLVFAFIFCLASTSHAKFDLKQYREQNRDKYGNADLETVANDIYYSQGFVNKYETPQEFYKQTGLDKQIEQYRRSKQGHSSQTQTVPPSGATQTLPIQNTEYFWSILIISFVITWSVGLAPPLIIRFLVFKRPLSRWVTITFAVSFYFINVVFFTLLGSQNKYHGGLFLVSMVSYYILRKGSKAPKTPTESLAKQKVNLP